MSISKLIVFAFLLSTSNEKFIYSVTSHNQNHDYYNVKIRFRFFQFLSICKIVLLHFMRLLLSGDIHLNPVPFLHIRESDMLIDIATKNCKILNICLFNARSLKNKYDFFTDFLTNLTQNTIVVLTETWLNETDIYPENFLSPKHKFYSKSRLSKTGVNKGGGVAIWVPRDTSSKQRNDLNVLNEIFFGSLWVEICGLSVSKFLINASYCPNKNLGNPFTDELTSETSSAHSITDEVLLLAIIISIISTKENPLYWMNLGVIPAFPCQTQKNQHEPPAKA